jgi:putative ABC transport system permease protein
VRARAPRDPRDLLEVALEALRRYKLRTALSVLGVILGVAAVIAMMSVAEGARADALQQITSLGLDNLVVRSPSGTANGRTSDSLTLADAGHLLRLTPYATAASPLVTRFAPVGHGALQTTATLLGVHPEYQRILNLVMERGRFLSPADERSPKTPCVLGHTLARRLLGLRAAPGALIRLEGGYCEVVGVLAEQAGSPQTFGALAWRDLNQSLLLPVAAVTRRSELSAPDQPVDEIWIHTIRGDRAEELGRIVAHTMARLHPDRTHVDVVIPRELLAQRYRTQRTFSVVLGSVAAIALIVGGIGIMNIMLTSVTERTKEIGVRRAVGATRRDVTLQFLTESLLMTLAGGTLGVALGMIASVAITAYAGWNTRISTQAIALGFGVSASVGLFFGLYPAMKAARFEPVDALHHE